jgi:hypothetical protein
LHAKYAARKPTALNAGDPAPPRTLFVMAGLDPAIHELSLLGSARSMCRNLGKQPKKTKTRGSPGQARP